MALTKQIEMVSNFGDIVVFNNAYFAITSISGNKNNIDVCLSLFKEKNGILIKSDIYSFIPSLQGENFITQAYEYLKTLEEFKDAEDC